MTDGFITIQERRLEYRLIPATDHQAPPLVFLHEGLGSISLWRDVPDQVAAATGSAVLLYSRYGFGRSDVLREPRRPDYLHAEALETLPRVLDHFAIADPVLIGHSDGASIALIHAGAAGRPVRGLIVEAAHVFVEDITITGIRDAVTAWETTDLARKLARHHADAGRTFQGWHGIWLDPAFRDWNIAALLPAITCPILVIQGENDEYGTQRQVDAIVGGVRGPARRLMLPDCGHTPHRDQAEAVLSAITAFVKGIRRQGSGLPG